MVQDEQIKQAVPGHVVYRFFFFTFDLFVTQFGERGERERKEVPYVWPKSLQKAVFLVQKLIKIQLHDLFRDSVDFERKG